MSESFEKKDIISILELFLEKIKNSDIDINLLKNIDYYWHIVDNDKLYDPTITPDNDLSLGQISDDRNELIRLISNERDMISYDFTRLSTIIRLFDYISENGGMSYLGNE